MMAMTSALKDLDVVEMMSTLGYVVIARTRELHSLLASSRAPREQWNTAAHVNGDEDDDECGDDFDQRFGPERLDQGRDRSGEADSEAENEVPCR